MTRTLRSASTFAGIGLVILATCILITNAGYVYGLIVNEGPASVDAHKFVQLMATSTGTTATTTTATSTNQAAYFDTNGRYIDGTLDIRGANKVVMYFQRGGIVAANTGSTTFKVQVTPDGTNWYDFTKLIQATSTTVQPTATIDAATSTLYYSLDLTTSAFLKLRCITVETTDGEHACAGYAEY